jgi:hypothetical protein
LSGSSGRAAITDFAGNFASKQNFPTFGPLKCAILERYSVVSVVGLVAVADEELIRTPIGNLPHALATPMSGPECWGQNVGTMMAVEDFDSGF